MAKTKQIVLEKHSYDIGWHTLKQWQEWLSNIEKMSPVPNDEVLVEFETYTNDYDEPDTYAKFTFYFEREESASERVTREKINEQWKRQRISMLENEIAVLKGEAPPF